MKKITFLLITVFCFAFTWQSRAQVLNESAAWPNVTWTLVGTYTVAGLEADPTLTANFGFNDDAAGSGSNDDIAAESPIIDLTAAHTAGEVWLTVSAQYVYRYLANDELVFQYWDADTSTWENWGDSFDTLGTTTTTNANFCNGTYQGFESEILDITSFTATQLSGFRYRISYDDDPAAADYNWGFCFQSPTIISAMPPSCPDPSDLTASNITTVSADLGWTENGASTNWDIEWGTDGFTPTGTPNVNDTVDNPYNLASLSEGTGYDFYVRADCGADDTDVSAWVGPFSFTTLFNPPSNDDCANAIGLTVNPDFACGTVTSGTVAGATDSGVSGSTCFGTDDDDVWYSFVATATSHRVSLSNVAGSVTDMYHAVYDATPGCGTLGAALVCSDGNTSNPSGLTIGNTYYVQVYTYTATAGQDTTFDICIGTPPPPPANDNFADAIALNCDDNVTGNTTYATLDEDDAPDGFGADLDAPNVWYSYTGSGTPETITIDLCPSGYDTSFLVYTGASGALTLIGGNDDNAAQCGTDSVRSYGSFTSDGTTTYYITVEGWNSGSIGAFDLTLTCESVCTPAQTNQDCASADPIAVSGTPVSVDNTCASVNATQPSCDSFNSIADIWYTFVAPTSGEVDITSTLGTATAAHIAVYSGACGTLTSLGCNVDVAGSLSLTGLTPAQTYYLQLWNNGTEEGTFDVTLSDPTLSLNPVDNNGFTYFPNPVKNTLQLNAQSNIQNVSIFNMLGQEVLRTTPNNVNSTVDMSAMQIGAYFVKVTINDRTETIRVIKN